MKHYILKEIRYHAYRCKAETGQSYTLSSGQQADKYLDIKNMILDDLGGQTLARHVAEAIAERKCYDVIAGVETGGALLARLAAGMLMRPTLLIRKGERSHGTRSEVEGLDNLPSVPPGNVRYFQDTWLVEDVITTGASTLRALEKLMPVERLRIAGVICAVDREQGGLAAVKDYLCKDVPVIALATLSEVRASRC